MEIEIQINLREWKYDNESSLSKEIKIIEPNSISNLDQGALLLFKMLAEFLHIFAWPRKSNGEKNPFRKSGSGK